MRNILKPIVIKPLDLMVMLSIFFGAAYATDIIPTSNNNNFLYYKIGGGSDLALPPVNDTRSINLDANADLGMGNTCGAFNPVLSLSNTFNNLKSDVDNIDQSVLQNATGSLAQIPMYLFAQAEPTAYGVINNFLLGAHRQLEISTKNCQQVKDQIAKGQNPYQDWGTIAVGNQWKQHLSLTSTGAEDINTASKEVDQHAGDSGITWVQGKKSDDGLHAGGLNQPPIHVISDTVKAGYNSVLLRDLDDDSAAPTGDELANQFPKPSDAVSWITNVVGDQTITTCNDNSCKSAQGGISGRGLLPWITACSDQNKNYCADTIRTNLANLVTNQTPMTNANLTAVSANGLVISPQVVGAIRSMDSTQQSMIISKISQEVATQRVVDRALLARNILQTGSQVPVIASNQPAQKIIEQAIQHLDKEMQSIVFETQLRKQMVSDTLTNLLTYQANQQQGAMQVTPVTPNQPLMKNGALQNQGTQK